MGNLVSLDLSDEAWEAGMRRLEAEEKWRAENPERAKAVDILGDAIIALEDLQKAVRSS